MYSNILVPIAPEEPLANSPSIKFAREILGPDGKITVISVVEVPPAYASAYIPKTQAKSLLQLQAKEMANRLSEMAKVEARAIQGHPARAILDEANSLTKTGGSSPANV